MRRSTDSQRLAAGGAPCHITSKKGHSAGVYLAVPKAVELQKAQWQASWDISPPDSPGRAVMALMQVKGGWLLLASLYLWTGQPLHSDGNSAILSVIVGWIIKLGLPWLVAADWQNDPAALADRHFNRAVHGVVKSPQEHTCRSNGGPQQHRLLVDGAQARGHTAAATGSGGCSFLPAQTNCG